MNDEQFLNEILDVVEKYPLSDWSIYGKKGNVTLNKNNFKFVIDCSHYDSGDIGRSYDIIFEINGTSKNFKGIWYAPFGIFTKIYITRIHKLYKSLMKYSKMNYFNSNNEENDRLMKFFKEINVSEKK